MELLSSQSLERLAVVPDDPSVLLLELQSPEGDATDSEARHAVRAVIDASVQSVNSFGKLRWRRTFKGLSIKAIKSFDSTGRAAQQVFTGIAYDHMLPEDYADMVERLGHPRPPLPEGLDVVNALEFEPVMTLAEDHPDVARVLHLIDLMLVGDEEIDWVAGYAAMEIIEQDLGARAVDGHALGWWSNAERARFKATANSPEALGTRARHGKRSGLTEARMTSKDAGWLVRRVAAHWLTYLQDAGA
jgi:hypothetical protein